MIRLPPRSTRTDTLFPYTTLFRSGRFLHRLELAGTLQNDVDAEGAPVDLRGRSRPGVSKALLRDQDRTVPCAGRHRPPPVNAVEGQEMGRHQIGRASWRARVCQEV